MITVKKSRAAIEIASLDKSNLFIRHNSREQIRKLPIHDHMIHVVKIDTLTGHEERGNLNFILKIIFHWTFIEKPCIFSKLIQYILKV